VGFFFVTFFVTARTAFAPNRTGGKWLSDGDLRASAQDGAVLTHTAVSPGSGQRLALDRDLDGVLDGDSSDHSGQS